MLDNSYELLFPQVEGQLEQDQEWVRIIRGKSHRKIRFHDYGPIYDIPGLYEKLFYEHLKCASPVVLTQMLAAQLNQHGARMADLRALDFGAGNGIVGEQLQKLGCSHVVGLDILPEAMRAAERDRPGVYAAYHVADLSTGAPGSMASSRFNCLITVAALGFNDIPTRSFLHAFNLVEDLGWVVFNIKERFLSPGDNTGYREAIESLVGTGALTVVQTQRYCHRLSLTGKQLYYLGVVGRKKRSVPVDEIVTAG